MADPEDPAGGETPFTPEGTPMWSGSRPASDLPGGIDRGQILGDRYRIEGVLGKGGMGEVWRARDLKLGIEVALKAHRVDTVGDRGRELLRAEVLAARQVVSPNVCRVFDLVTVAGRELVAMEYIDGTTLLDVLRERGPLEVGEARELAS
jgi:serine/threonine protein kinase